MVSGEMVEMVEEPFSNLDKLPGDGNRKVIGLSQKLELGAGALQGFLGREPATFGGFDRRLELGFALEQRCDLFARQLVGGAVGEPCSEFRAIGGELLELVLGGLRSLAKGCEP
jgi:hypothetical protein